MVCGLALPLPDQPVGEERLQGGGERGHGRPARCGRSSRCAGQRRAARVRRTDTSRCRPGRRGRGRWTAAAAGPHVAAGAVPVEQGGDREACGADRGCGAARRRPGLQPGPARPAGERRADVAVEQPGAGRGDEQRRGAGPGVQPVAAAAGSRAALAPWSGAAAPAGTCRTWPGARSARRRRGRGRRGRGGSPRRPASR